MNRNATVGVALGFAAAVVSIAIACIPEPPWGTPPDLDATNGAEVSSGAGEDAPDDAGSGDASSGTDSSGSMESSCGNKVVELEAGEQCDPRTDGVCDRTCRVTCDGYVWPKNNHCYKLLRSATPNLVGQTNSATTLCKLALGFNGHVVTFASDVEFRAVLANFADAGVDGGSFWVGLLGNGVADSYVALRDYEPGWSPTCTGCFAHVTDRAKPIPNSDAKNACVQAAFDPDASWSATKCTGSPALRVICEREPVQLQSRVPSCDGGVCIDLVWTFPNKTYLYEATAATASDAEQSCRDLGGRLAVFGSPDEREQLWYQLSQLTIPPSQIWIGLSQMAVAAGSDAGDGGDAAETGPPEAGALVWVWDDEAAVEGHPSQWGNAEPQKSGSSRAFMSYIFSSPENTLAQNDLAPPTATYVCEFGGDAGM